MIDISRSLHNIYKVTDINFIDECHHETVRDLEHIMTKAVSKGCFSTSEVNMYSSLFILYSEVL